MQLIQYKSQPIGLTNHLLFKMLSKGYTFIIKPKKQMVPHRLVDMLKKGDTYIYVIEEVIVHEFNRKEISESYFSNNYTILTAQRVPR